jgi:hypothetical protein
MTKSGLMAILMIAALVLPVGAGAHEGHTHKALGTIASAQSGQVEIKTTEGKSLTVMLDAKTTVTRGKDKLDATALRVGERVSVDYVEANKVMTARAIKLGTTTAAKK